MDQHHGKVEIKLDVQSLQMEDLVFLRVIPKNAYFIQLTRPLV